VQGFEIVKIGGVRGHMVVIDHVHISTPHFVPNGMGVGRLEF
jgi:hypothetical protein